MNECFNCGYRSDTEVHKRVFPFNVERMLCKDRCACVKRELAKIKKEAQGKEEKLIIPMI